MWLKRKRWESKGYLDYVRQLACCHCGQPPPSHPHHHARKGEKGGQRKPDDCFTVPLCFTCHIGNVHQRGTLQGLTPELTRQHFDHVQRTLMARWITGARDGEAEDPLF